MGSRQGRIALAIIAILVAGVVAAPALAFLRCTSPWLTPLASLLVALPALYGFGFLLEALWESRKSRRDAPGVALYKARADTLRDVAGKVPPPLLVLLMIGVLIQVLFAAAELRVRVECVAALPVTAGVEAAPPDTVNEEGQ